MGYLEEFFSRIRSAMIDKYWKPAAFRTKPGFFWQYFSPSDSVNINGQNSARNLTDENLAYDLPFLLAKNNGIRELDLSHNRLKSATILKLSEKIFLTKINTINLSHNPLDETAKKELPHLIRWLKKINLSNCHLSKKNIADLISALNQSPSIIELDVSSNQATKLQLAEIKKLLERNKIYNLFKNKYQKKDVLDLERYSLNAKGIKDLAFYVSRNVSFFSDNVKEIKAPILDKNLTDIDFTPLIEALKKNNYITTLTMDFRQFSSETEQKIRTQLMFNKARQKMARNLGIINYLITGFIAALILTTIMPIIPVIFAFFGIIASRLIYNGYFFYRLRQAKQADFNQAENIKAIECGKNSVDSWLSYLNPRTYTPYACLGHTIEKENLSTKYDVSMPCFKPKLKHKLV